MAMLRVFRSLTINRNFSSRSSMEELRSLRMVTAIKTPYQPDGKIDLASYDNLVNMQIEKGVQGILVGAEADRGFFLTAHRELALISHTCKSFGNKIKIIGNFGRKLTYGALRESKIGFGMGMDVAIYTNPHIECQIGFSTYELSHHFNCLLPTGPAIIHNVPYTSPSFEIPLSLVEELSENHNLVGFKENKRVEIYASKGIHVWTRDDEDEESHEARWEYGATGVYSLAANLVPGLMNQLMFEGKNPSLNIKLKPLFDWLFHTPLARGWDTLSVALAQLGVAKPVVMGLCVSLEKRREFVDLVEEIGRDNFVGEKDVQVLDDRDFVVLGWRQMQEAI